jgi:hypothetical protein
MKSPLSPLFQRGELVARLLIIAVLLLGSAVHAASDTGAGELLARIDALWARRNARGAVPDMVTLATLVLDMDQESYDAEWRVARAYFWSAYTQPSRLLKKSLAAKAIEWAERARRRAADRVEGHYFYAVAVGQYASTIGVVTAVSDGVVDKFESAARRAYDIDRDYVFGAPGIVLGRYYFLLPWPLRDVQRSRHYLEEVVARHPTALIARCYLAEAYHEMDEDALARAQLEYVLSHDLVPGTELEQPEPKPFARQAMKQWFE